jgi:uncharacterized OB-fold protein
MIDDWTTGGAAIAYQRCTACGGIWYFRRSFCPSCGGAPETLASSGAGTVHAATLVARAPSPELRALAPYAILLVDMDEGFRMMAHGAQGLGIGERVRARFAEFAGRRVPHFEREP